MTLARSDPDQASDPAHAQQPEIGSYLYANQIKVHLYSLPTDTGNGVQLEKVAISATLPLEAARPAIRSRL